MEVLIFSAIKIFPCWTPIIDTNHYPCNIVLFMSNEGVLALLEPLPPQLQATLWSLKQGTGTSATILDPRIIFNSVKIKFCFDL